jgi:hypothetical protein
LTNLIATHPGLTLANTRGNFSGKLGHSGDSVKLEKPDDLVSTNLLGQFVTNKIHIAVDEVTYGVGGRWGQWTHGDGSSLELIDPRTVAPLDLETIRRSVAKTGRLLIVDEAFAPFGLGAEIATAIADSGFDDLDAPIRRLNGAFTPTPYSPTLEAAVVPSEDQIAQAIRDSCAE